MLAAGWAAQKIVDQTARQSSVNVTEREQVSRLLNDLSNDIWQTETALTEFPVVSWKTAAHDDACHHRSPHRRYQESIRHRLDTTLSFSTREVTAPFGGHAGTAPAE